MSASLRLHQPPAIKLHVLKSLSGPSNFLSTGAPSTLDVYYSAQSALQAFFDSFFSLPTESYPVMPVYIMLDVLWSIPILARWAKVMGPGRSRPTHAPPDILAAKKVLWDPSSGGQAMQNFGLGLAPAPSFTTAEASDARDSQRQNLSAGLDDSSVKAMKSVNTCATRLAGLPPPLTDPSQMSTSEIHDATDVSIPRAIVSLRDKLKLQSGLNLDIIGILSTLAQRCEQAHQELVGSSPDGSWQSDIWFMCSKKILIARAKLEKWADIVAAGGVTCAEQTKVGSKAKENTGFGDADVPMDEDPGLSNVSSSVPASDLSQRLPVPLQHNELAAFQREIENAGQELGIPEATYDTYMDGSVWTDDMFMPLDPSLWLDNFGDWPAQDTMNNF